MSTLIDLDNKVIIMHLVYTTKLGFCARKNNVNIQKIDKFYLDMFEIIIADYLVKTKFKRV